MNTRKISHIGVLVHDADAATELWTTSFGLKKFADRRIEVEGIRSVFISVGGTWDEMVIEIMEPLDKSNMDNALSRRLARVGEGFYHLCLEVDDVEVVDVAVELVEVPVVVDVTVVVVLDVHPGSGRAQSCWSRSVLWASWPMPSLCCSCCSRSRPQAR